jgi:hypothetical protein
MGQADTLDAKTVRWNKTLVLHFVDHVGILVHGDLPPDEAEWIACVEALRSGIKEQTVRGLLVFTDGVGPNAAQRRYATNALSQRFPVGVVTRSRMARGLATAIQWFHEGLALFAPRDLPAALIHVRLSGRLSEVQETVEHASEMLRTGRGEGDHRQGG